MCKLLFQLCLYYGLLLLWFIRKGNDYFYHIYDHYYSKSSFNYYHFYHFTSCNNYAHCRMWCRTIQIGPILFQYLYQWCVLKCCYTYMFYLLSRNLLQCWCKFMYTMSNWNYFGSGASSCYPISSTTTTSTTSTPTGTGTQIFAVPAGKYVRNSVSCSNYSPTTCETSCTTGYTVTQSGSTNVFVSTATNLPSGCTCETLTTFKLVGTYGGTTFSVSGSPDITAKIGTDSQGCTLTYSRSTVSAAERNFASSLPLTFLTILLVLFF
jgi:hypothetical protein